MEAEHKNSISEPTVPVKLDRVRNFRIDFNALAKMEERTGKNILDPKSFANLSVRDMRAMLLCALEHEDSELTEKRLGSMLHLRNLQYAFGRFSAAWKTSSGEGDKGLPFDLANPMATMV